MERERERESGKFVLSVRLDAAAAAADDDDDDDDDLYCFFNVSTL